MLSQTRKQNACCYTVLLLSLIMFLVFQSCMLVATYRRVEELQSVVDAMIENEETQYDCARCVPGSTVIKGDLIVDRLFVVDKARVRWLDFGPMAYPEDWHDDSNAHDELSTEQLHEFSATQTSPTVSFVAHTDSELLTVFDATRVRLSQGAGRGHESLHTLHEWAQTLQDSVHNSFIAVEQRLDVCWSAIGGVRDDLNITKMDVLLLKMYQAATGHPH